MIGSLRGTLVDKGSLRVTVEVGGVGYEIQIPLSTYEGIGDPGGEVFLWIHTHVRKDSLSLFGFHSKTERRLFERLISVSGIGTKIALALLSGLGVVDLLRAVRDRESGVLQHVPGVGRKTAERLVVELQDRVGSLLQEISAGPDGGEGSAGEARREDVISALVNLGYRRREASEAVERGARGTEQNNLETMLKEALRALSSP